MNKKKTKKEEIIERNRKLWRIWWALEEDRKSRELAHVVHGGFVRPEETPGTVSDDWVHRTADLRQRVQIGRFKVMSKTREIFHER